jgi:excisionase family DNA binding protein
VILDGLSDEARDELRTWIRGVVDEALAEHREQRRWLTVDEAAAHLGTTANAIRHRVAAGRLPVRRQGRRLLFDRRELDRLLERS